MSLDLKDIAESINVWNGFLSETIDWNSVVKGLNITLSDWADSCSNEDMKICIYRLSDSLYITYREADDKCERREIPNRIEVKLDEAACSIVVQTDLAEYDRDQIRKENVARLLNRLNRHLVAGRFYQESNHIYYSEGIDVRENGEFDKHAIINAIRRTRLAVLIFNKGGNYILENESFISSLYSTVPRIKLCDECSVWTNGDIVIDNLHLLKYTMSFAWIGEKESSMGCVFCDLNGYIMLSPTWYAREYEYILKKRIEYGADYEDIDFLQRGLNVFRDTYSEIKSDQDRQVNKYHYLSGLRVEAKPLIRKILGDAAVIMYFDNGRSFLAPKEAGYILQKFGKGKMESWEAMHKRLEYGDVPITEDEKSLEWLRSVPEECDYEC